MTSRILLSFCASLCLAGAAAAQERLPMIPASQQTEAQKKAIADLTGGSFGVGGPFIALLREPKLAEESVDMATYFRKDSVLGPRLTEFEILLAAREYTQQFEWTAHYARALQMGVKQATIDAIAAGQRPLGMPDDEAIVYDFWSELTHNKGVSDATYARALKKFGERGVVTMTALNGYYGMLAMVLNVSRAPILPANAKVPLLPALPNNR